MTTVTFELPPEIAERLDNLTAKVDHLTALVEPKQDFLTTEEVAKLLKCKPDTVRRKGRAGELRIAKRVGHKMLFDPKDINRAS